MLPVYTWSTPSPHASCAWGEEGTRARWGKAEQRAHASDAKRPLNAIMLCDRHVFSRNEGVRCEPKDRLVILVARPVGEQSLSAAMMHQHEAIRIFRQQRSIDDIAAELTAAADNLDEDAPLPFIQP
jgi:hypothetical protein